MEDVDDDIDELSPTSSCHTSHQNNPGLRPNNADFSYHAKPYIPNSIINPQQQQPSNRVESNNNRSNSNSLTRKTKRFLKPIPSKDRQASPIQLPTVNSSVLKSMSKELKPSTNDDKVYKGEVFIYKA